MIRHMVRMLCSSSHSSSSSAASLIKKLSNCSQIPEVFSILHSENLSSKDSIFGLRMIARMVKENSENIGFLKDPRYKAIQQTANTNITNLTAVEVSHFCFWLKVMKQSDTGTVDIDKSALKDRIAQLCKNNEFSPKQEINLLYNCAFFKLYIGQLNKNILNFLSDSTQVFSFFEIWQILTIAKEDNSPLIRKITDRCFTHLLSFRNELFEVSDIVQLLDILESSKDSLYKFKLNVKLINVLRTKIGSMTEKNILDIIHHSIKFPKMKQMLLRNIFDDMSTKMLHHDWYFSKKFLIQFTKEISDLYQNQDIVLPTAISEQFLNLIEERMDEFNLDEVCKILLNVSAFPKQLYGSLVEKMKTMVENETELKGFNLVVVARVLSQLSPDYPIESLVQDKTDIDKSLAELPLSSKIEAVDHISRTKNTNDCILSWRKLLVEDMCEYVKDYSNAKEYTKELAKIHCAEATKILLSDLHKEVLLTLAQNLEPKDVIFVLCKSLVLTEKNFHQWEAFIDAIKSYITDSTLKAFLRAPNLPIDIKHINKLLRILPPTASSLIIAAPKCTNTDHPQEFDFFLDHFNTIPAESHDRCNYENLDSFFESIKLMGRSHKLSHYFKSLNQYLKTSKLKSSNTLRACAILESHNYLDETLAHDIVAAHQNTTFPDDLSLVLKIAAHYPACLKDKNQFLNRVLNTSLAKSNAKTADRLINYLWWPDTDKDAEFEVTARSNLQCFNIYDLNACIHLLKKLSLYTYELHEQLVSGVMNHISNIIPEHTSKLLIAEAVQLLKSISFNQHHRLNKTYESLLEKLQKKYNKLQIDQKLSVVLSLARRGIKDKQLLQKYAEESIHKQNMQWSCPIVFSAIAEVGFHSEDWAVELFEKALTLKPKDISSHWIWTLLMFSAPQQHLEQAIHTFNSTALPETPQFRRTLLYNHFQANPTSLPINHFLPDNRIYEDHNIFKLFGVRHSAINRFKNALERRAQTVETYKYVKGLFAPLYLPKTGTVVWPLTPAVLTYNKEHLRGSMMMYSEQLQKVSDRLVTVDLANLDTEETFQDWCDHLVS